MTTTPMTNAPIVTVEPGAALQVVGLVAAQLRRLLDEAEPDQPYLLHLLAGGLEEISEHGRPLSARQVGLLRLSVWRGRRLDMAEAFNRLNPSFGVQVRGWCWRAGVAPDSDASAKAATQRRELELSMGERFARLLAPARQGGEAA